MVQIVKEPGFGTMLGQAFGTGLGSGLQDLAKKKMQEIQGQKLGETLKGLGLPPELGPLALQAPQLASAIIKQQGVSQQKFQQQQQLQQERQSEITKAAGLFQNLQELQEAGGIDKPFGIGFLGGADADRFDLGAKELEKKLKKVFPDAVVPTSKMDAAARQEGLARIENRLVQALQPSQAAPQGAPQDQAFGLGGQPQLPQEGMQPQQEGVPQEEGALASTLRNLLGAGVGSVAPLAQLAGRAIGAPLVGAPVLGSDIIQGLESLGEAISPVRGDQPSKEALAKLSPDEREYRDAILSDKTRLSDFLPTTSNIKKIISQVLPDKFLEPKSKNEALVQDAINKGLNLIAFGGKSPLRAAVATGTGIAGREFVKNKTNWGPVAQNATELLFTMAPDILFNKARQTLKGVAKKGYDSFPGSESSREINIGNLKQNARELRNSAGEFETLPTNARLKDKMNEFLEKTTFDKMRLGDAVETKKQINRFINEVNLDAAGEKLLSDFNRNLSDTVVSESKRLKIPNIEAFENANAIWRGLKVGESVVDSMKNLWKKGRYGSLVMRFLYGAGPISAGGAFAGRLLGFGIAKGGALGLVGQEIFQTYKFLRNTPGAWEELGKIAVDSLRGNTIPAAARMGRLDRKALQFEKKQTAQAKIRARRGL